MDILCIDIETGPCYESMARNPFKPDSVKLGNLKDPEKVKAKLADAERDFEKDAALHPEKGEVLAVGFMNSAGMCIHCSTEEEILVKSWETISRHLTAQRPIVGWNILEFDLPFLINRSRLHGVHVPIEVFRYDGRWIWHSKFKDLMKLWVCGKYGSMISQDKVARFLGVGSKPAGMHGGMFAELFHSQDETKREQALDYLRNDLQMLQGIAGKML